MGRPREHDRDVLLDAARALWVGGGVGAVTIRAVSAASGASNGALYHAFDSRDGLLARVWAREATRFLAYQRTVVDEALGDGPVEAVVALALAPASYAARDEDGARLLLAVTPDDLAAGELTDDQREELARLRGVLHDLLVELAELVWHREDPSALLALRACVVDLPGVLLLRPGRLGDPLAQHTLVAAVRGVLAEPPPTR